MMDVWLNSDMVNVVFVSSLSFSLSGGVYSELMTTGRITFGSGRDVEEPVIYCGIAILYCGMFCLMRVIDDKRATILVR